MIALLKADSVEEALQLANSVEYGLSASIFTANIKHLLSFVNDMEAGLIRVNAESAGVELQAPFGGMKTPAPTPGNKEKQQKSFLLPLKRCLSNKGKKQYL